MATPTQLASTTDLTIWTGYQEQYNASNTLTAYTIEYYHAPVLAYLPIAMICLLIIMYTVNELKHRLQKL